MGCYAVSNNTKYLEMNLIKTCAKCISSDFPIYIFIAVILYRWSAAVSQNLTKNAAKKNKKNAQFHTKGRETTERWFNIQNKQVALIHNFHLNQDFILIYSDTANI